ncbi:MAG: hypothetical protein WBA31_02250 [Candidatus Dormiibacterota bacterium]
MEERYLLQDRRTGLSVEVRGFPLELDGDPELSQRIQSYLEQPLRALGSSLDDQTGERGTGVVTLSPGQPGWLKGCLRQASEDLNLRLREVTLGAG